MNVRLQSFVHAAILAAIVGWVLYIGKEIFVPVVFSVLVVYVIDGGARLLGRIPLLGPALPQRGRYMLSVLVIGFVLVECAYLIVAGKDSVVALAPQYQESLLAVIQKVAVFFRVENEPTWTTLRQDLVTQVNLQRLIGSTVVSVSSLAVSVVVVCLYAVFLLVEQRSFAGKLANLTDDARRAAQVRDVIVGINTRIGSYLALKTFLSVLLGAVSWGVMRVVGLEFAGFWAVLIALLNYVPYLGSALGVMLPAAMGVVQFGAPGEVITLVLALSAVQFVIGNFLDPYVMGNSLNLSPFAILVSLTVWSGLWGIAGAFLAVPITAIVAMVFSQFPGTRPIAVLLSRDGRV